MYTVLDFETTGLDPKECQIIEVGAIKLASDLTVIGKLELKVKLVNGAVLSDFIKELTGLTEADLAHGLHPVTAKTLLLDFIGSDVIVAQFASFDLSFLDAEPTPFICTRSMFNLLYPEKKAGLKDIVAHYGIQYKNHHQAMADVEMTVQAFAHLKAEVDAKEINYMNVMTEKERPLKYVPKNAEVITITVAQ